MNDELRLRRLHDAISSSDCTPSVIRKIVTEQPDLLNSIYVNGWPSLFFAMSYAHPAGVISELLQLGADVHFVGYRELNSLHYALLNYCKKRALFDIVQLLTKFGSDVNAKSYFNQTPVHMLFQRVEGDMLLKVLDFLLRNGVKTDHVSENFGSYLEYARSTVRKFSDGLEVSKMLLEFGVKPDKNMHKYKINFEKEISHPSIQFVKLLMQYILINEIETYCSKDEKLVSRELYDKMFSLNDFSEKRCFKELTDYRDSLIRELSMMLRDKIDKNVSLFSFISERCSSGLNHTKSEEPLLYKVIGIFHSNRYVCCNDLFRTSIKHEPLLSVIPNVCIYARKTIPNSSLKTKVILTGDAVLEIATYLTRQDVLNLALAYWI